jgi:hypothetical protein
LLLVALPNLTELNLNALFSDGIVSLARGLASSESGLKILKIEGSFFIDWDTMYSLLHAVARSKVEELKLDDNQWELNDWDEFTYSS